MICLVAVSASFLVYSHLLLDVLRATRPSAYFLHFVSRLRWRVVGPGTPLHTHLWWLSWAATALPSEENYLPRPPLYYVTVSSWDSSYNILVSPNLASEGTRDVLGMAFPTSVLWIPSLLLLVINKGKAC